MVQNNICNHLFETIKVQWISLSHLNGVTLFSRLSFPNLYTKAWKETVIQMWYIHCTWWILQAHIRWYCVKVINIVIDLWIQHQKDRSLKVFACSWNTFAQQQQFFAISVADLIRLLKQVVIMNAYMYVLREIWMCF